MLYFRHVSTCWPSSSAKAGHGSLMRNPASICCLLRHMRAQHVIGCLMSTEGHVQLQKPFSVSPMATKANSPVVPGEETSQALCCIALCTRMV